MLRKAWQWLFNFWTSLPFPPFPLQTTVMHYIRFLSPPKVSDGPKSVLIVTAVIAVTTDLGDDFFADDLALTARLLDVHNPDKIFDRRQLSWQGQSRALKLSLQCSGKHVSRDVRMHVTTSETRSNLPRRCVPDVLDVWSAPFHLTDKQRAEPMVERQLVLANDSTLRILEETGDSIARHIWDASLGFLQYFDNAFNSGDKASGIRQLISEKRARPLGVIELGAGCGIVGIAFAQLVKCNVLLTDLDDATNVLTRNIRLATPSAGSSLKAQVLDWSKDLDSSDTKFDLILVSDCIYNPDTSVHLVETLQKLAQQTPSTLVLVGYKQRHTADHVFFDHMQSAKFTTLKTSSIQLSHRKSNHDDAIPTIEFYEYHLPI